MLISIITLNYKKKELTLSCLKSLYDQFRDEFEKNLMEVIVVDNASGKEADEIKKEVESKKYKNSKVIENDQNYGFGKGCNIGAKGAEGEYLLFLNNDTVVKDKSLLEMVNYLNKNQKVSILGGQLKNMDESLQISSGSFYNLFSVTMLLAGLQRLGMVDKSPREIKKVDWVKGGLFMIRRDVFEKLNGFDENIFMYTEDMELCFRAKQKGFLTYFYPFTNVLHEEHGSTNRTFAIVNIYKNLLYFYKKHKSYPEYLILKVLLFTKAYVLILVGILLNNNYLKDTYKQAVKGI
ncbi:MAG: glycosyltransferase family 2 protein [Candidatus Levybacteria bacterium]|nr:glycosyltransferase family 2 protein [Candidatus Levybacteria bacterium]